MRRTVFCSKLFGGGAVDCELCEKYGTPHLSADLASPALYCLHSVISDFRPPSVTESGQDALRRLLESRAIGGYSLASDDLAPGSLTLFQSTRVAQPQDASKAPLPWVTADELSSFSLGCAQAAYASSCF